MLLSKLTFVHVQHFNIDSLRVAQWIRVRIRVPSTSRKRTLNTEGTANSPTPEFVNTRSRRTRRARSRPAAGPVSGRRRRSALWCGCCAIGVRWASQLAEVLLCRIGRRDDTVREHSLETQIDSTRLGEAMCGPDTWALARRRAR